MQQSQNQPQQYSDLYSNTWFSFGTGGDPDELNRNMLATGPVGQTLENYGYGSAARAGYNLQDLANQQRLYGPISDSLANRNFGQVYQGAYQSDPGLQAQFRNAAAQSGAVDPRYNQGMGIAGRYSDESRDMYARALDAANRQRSAAGAAMAQARTPFSSNAYGQLMSGAKAQAAQQASQAVSAKGVNPALAARLANQGKEQAYAQAMKNYGVLRQQEAQAQQAQRMQAAEAASGLYGQAGASMATGANMLGQAGDMYGALGRTALGYQGQQNQFIQQLLGQGNTLSGIGQQAGMQGERDIQRSLNRGFDINQNQMTNAAGIRGAYLARPQDQSILGDIVGSAISGAGAGIGMLAFG